MREVKGSPRQGVSRFIRRSRAVVVVCAAFVVPPIRAATADCIVQDSSGLIRGMRLGEGSFRVTVKLRDGEAKPEESETLRRVSGLSAVVDGYREGSLLSFDGVAEGTWQLGLVSEQIESVTIVAAHSDNRSSSTTEPNFERPNPESDPSNSAFPDRSTATASPLS